MSTRTTLAQIDGELAQQIWLSVATNVYIPVCDNRPMGSLWSADETA